MILSDIEEILKDKEKIKKIDDKHSKGVGKKE